MKRKVYFPKKNIIALMKKYKVKLEFYNEIRKGIYVELEHGLQDILTNVTYDSLEITFRIALAHIIEFPDYYVRLAKMEKNADKYWKSRSKPKILR